MPPSSNRPTDLTETSEPRFFLCIPLGRKKAKQSKGPTLDVELSDAELAVLTRGSPATRKRVEGKRAPYKLRIPGEDGPKVLNSLLKHVWKHAKDPNIGSDGPPPAPGLLRNLFRLVRKVPDPLLLGDKSQLVHALPFKGGSTSDVYKAKRGNQLVALKQFRVQGSDVKKLEFYEALVEQSLSWCCLSHENVLPFLGFDVSTFSTPLSWPPQAGLFPSNTVLCTVAPWMTGGTVLDYLREHAGTDILPRLIREVAEGLAYLHSQAVVHGDLRGTNILVDERGCARLADYGLSRPLQLTELSRASPGFLPPELLEPDESGIPAAYSDVHAFASLCLEMHTLKPPLHGMNDMQMVNYSRSGRLPARPTGKQNPPDALWGLMERCWCLRWRERPAMFGVLEEVCKIPGAGQAKRQYAAPSHGEGTAGTARPRSGRTLRSGSAEKQRPVSVAVSSPTTARTRTWSAMAKARPKSMSVLTSGGKG